MAENSHISWTHHTFNPWIGCAHVSDGCRYCYAEEQQDHRYGRVKWGLNGTRSRTSSAYWMQPDKWNNEARKGGFRYRVFCASLADVFEDRPELEPWRQQLWAVIKRTTHLDWLLLTKRPENIDRLMPVYGPPYPRWPNVWIGTTVEDDRVAARIDDLVSCERGSKRFISYEPALGPIAHLDFSGIDWVIAGGESGPHARPADPQWFRDVRDVCKRDGIAFHLKQFGGRRPGGDRELDGIVWDELPGEAAYL